MRSLMILLCSLAALGATVGVTLSAFSDEATNGGNSFEAASSFGGNLQTASGSYTGDGVDYRSIDTGFQPDVVIVKGDTGQTAVMRTSTMAGDSSKPLSGATALSADMIQYLDADGFTLGRNGRVNTDGTKYYWQAFKADPSVLKVGTYTGNGSASQSVTGTGFSPEYAAVLPATAQRANHRFSGMTRGFQFDGDTGTTTRVTSLDADGFGVGNSAEVNSSGATYHYVAFNEVAGRVKKGSYAGTGANQNVTGVGFSPAYVMVRANDTSTSRPGNHRAASVPGSQSLLYSATANTTTGITSLLADGFSVGTNAVANANGPTYHHLAYKNTASGCSAPGSQTLDATADSRVEDANPGNNYGGSDHLRVTSRAGANKRSHVKFDLPTVPAGCSVTSAKLRLYDDVPVAGRTIEAIQNAPSWTENGVTWSNQPATTGSAATATTPSANAWVEWSVTSQVLNMYAGSNFGFKLRDATENGGSTSEQTFLSRDAGSDNPQLVVTFG